MSSESRLNIKICGITRLEDTLIAADAGADMLGLNFYTKSKRYVTPSDAAILAAALRQQLNEHCPLLIGVFVNATQSEIQAIIDQVGLDGVQLSGDEAPEVLHALGDRAFKALRPLDAAQVAAQVVSFGTHNVSDQLPSLLLDAYHPGAYGGTGLQADVGLALDVKAHTDRLMLAGGLTPENVAEIVVRVQPWGVDVASGVEDDVAGVKSETKLRAFIVQARRAVAQQY